MSELDWRRQWKPDLLSCPWRMLRHNSNLFIKANFLEDSYEVLVTDLAHFWHEHLSENDLKRKISKLNPSIEAPLKKVLAHIESNLQSDAGKKDCLTVDYKEGDGQQDLKITLLSELAGMPFSFEFKLSKCKENMGKDHLSLPLMSMVSELLRQQQELFKMMEQKDKEILHYKNQGVYCRFGMMTDPFDAVAFKNNMVTSKGFEECVRSSVCPPGGQTFTSQEAQRLYRDINTKLAWLQRDTATGDGEAAASSSMSAGDTVSRSASGPSVESWANRLPGSVAQRANNVSPSKSPDKSPVSSPASSKASSTEVTPVKDSEFLRRQALERKLALEEEKLQAKAKKKKKLKF